MTSLLSVFSATARRDYRLGEMLSAAQSADRQAFRESVQKLLPRLSKHDDFVLRGAMLAAVKACDKEDVRRDLYRSLSDATHKICLRSPSALLLDLGQEAANEWGLLLEKEMKYKGLGEDVNHDDVAKSHTYDLHAHMEHTNGNRFLGEPGCAVSMVMLENMTRLSDSVRETLLFQVMHYTRQHAQMKKAVAMYSAPEGQQPKLQAA